MGRALRLKDTESYLYQVYCIGTVEQAYADKRSVLLKKNCKHFEEFILNVAGNDDTCQMPEQAVQVSSA
jgi:hypothetical protein